MKCNNQKKSQKRRKVKGRKGEKLSEKMKKGQKTERNRNSGGKVQR